LGKYVLQLRFDMGVGDEVIIGQCSNRLTDNVVFEIYLHVPVFRVSARLLRRLR
jgi:hypothetical protein